jgi:hypothetical protein
MNHSESKSNNYNVLESFPQNISNNYITTNQQLILSYQDQSSALRLELPVASAPAWDITHGENVIGFTSTDITEKSNKQIIKEIKWDQLPQSTEIINSSRTWTNGLGQ